MPSQQHPPTTPSPKSGRTGKITDFFKSTHQSEPKQPTKREFDVEDQDPLTAKRLKRSDARHADSSKTVRYKVDIDTPKPRKPASARLLDDTDGGLRDSLVGRWDFRDEESVEVDDKDDNKHPELSAPIQTPARVNNPRRRNPASSRLLADVGGGLSDSLVGRFETPRYEEAVSRGGEEKGDNDSTHDTVDDDSEAETIKADEGVDEMSSDGNRDEDDDEEDGTEAEDSEGDDSDKENVDPRDRYRASSLPPATPEHHGNQAHGSADSTPTNQPSASPSSFLLPSPVVDLPPVSSPPSSSTPLAPVPPSTMPSPPSTP